MRTDGRSTKALLENGAALARLKKNFYHLWKPLMEAQENPSVLDEWHRAPRGSQEWRRARQYDEALRVLEVAVSD